MNIIHACGSEWRKKTMAKVAIMGYGTVGSGVYDIIKMNSAKLSESAGEALELKYILDIRDFDDHPEKHLFTKDVNDIINDDEISVVAEVMGGLHPAYEFTKQLLMSGKSVVTSNKELVATYGSELLAIAEEKNVNYMFEASVGGGIPVIRPLNRCLGANNVKRIAGILNGTTNFILTLMETENLDFNEALTIADGLGYVEANPSLDLDGIDAAHKICILAQNGFKKFIDFDKISVSGIRNVTKVDMDYAKKLGYRFKMIAQAKEVNNGIGIDVAATLVNKKELVANVMDAYNVIEIDNDYVENVIFYGKGAGRYVTASAVVSDIIKTTQKEYWNHDYQDCQNIYPITKSKYYLRCDRPIDVDYELYFTEKQDHIYITHEVELAKLTTSLGNLDYTIFKVRG